MPPNQLAQVTSSTPAVLRIRSACDVGMLKIIDIEGIVKMRVAELAADTASNPSRMARSEANRKTARPTLIIVNAVRRLLRRALFRTRPMNFMVVLSAANSADRRRGLFDQRPFLEVQQVRCAFGGVRIVSHHHDRLLE